MKKRDLLIFSYGFVAGIGLIIASLSVWHMYSETRFVKYEHPTGFFRMTYPPNWTLIENEGGAAAIFYSPLENELDIFKENVNIVIQDLSKNPMPLKQYTKTAINQMKVVFKEGMNIVESTPTYLSGMEAHKFVFEGSGPDGDLRFMSIWTVKGETAFQFTYTALKTEWDEYKTKADKMAKSFRITKW
jgi:hypothetical protein